jgi:hypothetical protein
LETGVVEDDRGGLAGDRGVDLLALLGRVVVVAEDQGLVAELLGLSGGGVLLGLEEHVVRGRRDDHDELGRRRRGTRIVRFVIRRPAGGQS